MRSSVRAAAAALAVGACAALAAAGCAAHYAEPDAHEEHGHLVVFNLSKGGRLVAYEVSHARSHRIVAFAGADTYRYVRLPPGKTTVRFEVNVGGVVYESDTFEITGDASRIVVAGVAGPKTVFREIGGPRGHDLIERSRTGSPLRWAEVE